LNPSDDRDGVITQFNGGDDCYKGSSSILYVFHCNTTAGAGSPSQVIEIGEQCVWVVHWETQYGCQENVLKRKIDLN